MNLGGDPSQALVHSNPDGKFMVALSAIDLGQGMKSVARQVAAETLGVPLEDVHVDAADSDTGPHDMGSFASRGTHRVGNAVIQAAREARSVMLEAAAEELEVDPRDLDTDREGNIHVRGAPSRSITTMAAAQAAQFKQGRTIAGRGIFLIPLSGVDPETGQMTPVSTFAHACVIAEVEVDDETGEVRVEKLTSAYEVGRALNPRLVEQQLVGGAWMGTSHALWETTEPYYPTAPMRRKTSTPTSCAAPATSPRTTSPSSNARPRTAPTAERARARCAPTRSSPPLPTPSTTLSASTSTTCRSRPKRSSAPSARTAAPAPEAAHDPPPPALRRGKKRPRLSYRLASLESSRPAPTGAAHAAGVRAPRAQFRRQRPPRGAAAPESAAR